MTYDDHAKLLAVKVIGTVESGLNYTSINYGDPITVGIMQWYGTRAAGILARIANEEPSSWTGAAQSVKDSLSAHPPTDGYWNSRWLTKEEGESLKPILKATAHIQTDQAQKDLEAYKQVAINIGMDIDGNTNAVIFFFTMYHQGHKYAMQVMASAGANSSIDRLRSYCLNNPTLGQYRNRYNTAYDLIMAGDISGVDEPTDPTPAPPGGDNSTGDSRLESDISYIEQIGTHLLIHRKGKSKLFAYFDGRQRWTITQDKDTGSEVVPPTTNPNPDPGGDTSTKMSAMINFAKSVENKYSYAQAPGRMDPESSGLTDCSGFVYYIYNRFYGINVGTWTVEQNERGTLIQHTSGALDESSMKIGDLILYSWEGGRVDHVEMYIGNATILGHPGPGKGPNEKPITWGSSAVYRNVRRYV